MNWQLTKDVSCLNYHENQTGATLGVSPCAGKRKAWWESTAGQPLL